MAANGVGLAGEKKPWNYYFSSSSLFLLLSLFLFFFFSLKKRRSISSLEYLSWLFSALRPLWSFSLVVSNLGISPLERWNLKNGGEAGGSCRQSRDGVGGGGMGNNDEI